MVIKFFEMTSQEATCILFQALTALTVTELFPYKLVRNEGLNNLPVEQTSCVIIVYIRKKCESVVEN